MFSSISYFFCTKYIHEFDSFEREECRTKQYFEDIYDKYIYSK